MAGFTAGFCYTLVLIEYQQIKMKQQLSQNLRQLLFVISIFYQRDANYFFLSIK